MEPGAVLVIWAILGGYIGGSIAIEGWSRLNIIGKATVGALVLPAAVVISLLIAAFAVLVTLIQLVFLKDPDYLLLEIWNGFKNKASKATEGDVE